MNRGAYFRMRLGGILRKEVLQIRRDPSSILLAIVMPMVLLFLFGYGVSLDAQDVPVAVVTGDQGPQARDLAARFALSPYFKLHQADSLAAAEKAMKLGTIEGIIHIQEGFSSDLAAGGRAQVQMIVNGVDANRARLVLGYAAGVLEKWGAVRRDRGEAAAMPAVAISPRIWFNPSAVSRNFLVPGLITLIMTLIGILLTALVVAREWERGTMEAILVTPIRRFDLLLGKVLPYYVLGMMGMTISVVVGILLFKVPFQGSFLVLFLLSSLFLLASMGFGLFISAVIRSQFVAAQIAILAGFLPALFLSGLLFDLGSTPRFIQALSFIVPARYFVAISHTLFMAGDVWSVLWPNGLALGFMAVFFIALAYRKITKRLEG